ncbi:outer membrane beta-barrel protein [Salinivibrio sp. ES.052]|uniref:outer membrane beta-barrel protein n=1 Tax=Salinivibrio sp. ES.052 TaxID=1882823 RepID=UPI000925F485|nr:outer membrane beta-barrel protein [Salinivibrio sp. ES.052]SIO35422.1 Outer membrane protein beta-barrel domain-containing protein [Salinivibrio sp. ES.052]
MTKSLSFATLFAGMLLATTAHAQTSPLSIGASASVTDVKYASQTETGYTWEVNGTLRVTDYTSLYSGYGETSADFDNTNGTKTTLTSSYIPVGVQVNFPMTMGSVYLRGGGNYYQTEFGSEKDIGWGATGTVGFELQPTVGPKMAFELTYADRGDAETSSVSVGTSIGF